MIDKPCPVCGTVQPAKVTRTDTGCTEWECSGCGKRWTVKDGEPDTAYAFFPSDVTEDALLDDSLEPFFAGS